VKSELLKEYNSGLSVALLALVGATITYGLFRWAMRNGQRCLWFISRAANFEAEVLKRPGLQFDGMAKAEHRTAQAVNGIALEPLIQEPGMPWGKTRSEKLIYWAAIASWLVPFGAGIYRWFWG
jgi:hypothetical protein